MSQFWNENPDFFAMYDGEVGDLSHVCDVGE